MLKDILGHEQLNTTQIYTHVSNRSMEEAMRHNPLSGEFSDDETAVTMKETLAPDTASRPAPGREGSFEVPFVPMTDDM